MLQRLWWIPHIGIGWVLLCPIYYCCGCSLYCFGVRVYQLRESDVLTINKAIQVYTERYFDFQSLQRMYLKITSPTQGLPCPFYTAQTYLIFFSWGELVTNGDGYCSIVGRQDERYIAVLHIYVGALLSVKCAAAVDRRTEMLCKFIFSYINSNIYYYCLFYSPLSTTTQVPISFLPHFNK